MNKYVFDTNFVVSFLNKEDENYKKAKEVSQTLNEEYIIMPSVVLSEIASFHKNPQLRNYILEETLGFLDEIFSLTDSNILEYIDFIQNIKSSFTAIDSIILYSAISTNSKLITFDKKLDNLYKSMI